MASAEGSAEATGKKSKIPLVLGLALALAGAGGGFYATYSGLLDSLLGGGAAGEEAAGHGAQAPAEAEHGAAGAGAGHGAEVAGPGANFVPLAPIVVSLGSRGSAAHLRFTAQLEVVPGRAAAVEALTPRILDVLNIYLRALDPHELEEPSALMRLRGQMLRRVQIVTGPDMVNDLLIIEFVFN